VPHWKLALLGRVRASLREMISDIDGKQLENTLIIQLLPYHNGFQSSTDGKIALAIR
jgi:hypothetical protein